MRTKHLWLLLAVALGVLLGYWWRHRPGFVTPATPVAAKPDVPIQDHKTIDFSSGRPVVKDSAQDKTIIDSAVKEMDAATKDITFAPSAPSAPPTKPADPAKAPPK